MNRFYRDKRWSEFREEVIAMDGYACVKCGRTSPEVTLQVHHKEYHRGKLPWDYPPALCETLCKGCHAREHGEIRPNEGWVLCAEEDLGGLDGECECCGTALRYVFCIHHEMWEPLAVGTNCCDNLTGTNEATQSRRRLDRKKRFLSSKNWERTASGLSSVRKRLLEIEIRSDDHDFRIFMNGIEGKRLFESERSAMEFIFDLIETGEAKKFAERNPLAKRRA